MHHPGTLLMLIIMLTAAAACGKIGDLYLPDDDQSHGQAVDTESVEQD